MVNSKMERWSGRVALVTGASSGIGAATVRELVKHGLKVVAVARRVERIEELGRELTGAKGKLYPKKVDVSNESEIISLFQWVKENLGGVDILINNAGVSALVTLTDGCMSEFQKQFQVNVIGLSICAKEAVKSMMERGVKDGHIININRLRNVIEVIPYERFLANACLDNEDLQRCIVPQGLSSWASSLHQPDLGVADKGIGEVIDQLESSKIHSVMGHYVFNFPGSFPYSATKHAVTVLTDGLSRELMRKRSTIRVTSVSPGLVETEMVQKPGGKITIKANTPVLAAEDIADAIIYVLGTPPHVQVNELTIQPVANWRKSRL